MQELKDQIVDSLRKSTGQSTDIAVVERTKNLGNEIGQAVADFHERNREVPRPSTGNNGDVITVENGEYVLKPVETSAQLALTPISGSPQLPTNFNNLAVDDLSVGDLAVVNVVTNNFNIQQHSISYNNTYETLQVNNQPILGHAVHTFGHGAVESQGSFELRSDSSPFIISTYTGYVRRITLGYNLLALLQAPRSFVVQLSVGNQVYSLYEMTEQSDPDDFTETLVIDSKDVSYPINSLDPIRVRLIQNGYEITDISVSLLCEIQQYREINNNLSKDYLTSS